MAAISISYIFHINKQKLDVFKAEYFIYQNVALFLEGGKKTLILE